MISRFVLSLFIFMFCVSAHAQVYKWVDADGKVTYSDVPPPKSVVKVETKSFSSSDEPNVALPYELAQAAKSMPVTLYTAVNCPNCDNGRAFLKDNGIPFNEKTVSTDKDWQKLAKVSGGNQVPVLFIGSHKLIGYFMNDWRSTLSDAGYPASNILPAGYQFPTPQPATPVAAGAKDPNAGSDPNQSNNQPAQPARDPNGFQF